MKILLPSSYKGALPKLPDDEVLVIDSRRSVPPQHRDADVLVVWLQPPHVLADAAATMPQLKLVQTLSAGPDLALNAGFAPAIPIASGVGCHDITVSQHTVALTLALTRDLPLAHRRQTEKVWDWRLGGTLKERADDGRVTSLAGAVVTIWGFGSIAKTLAPLLAARGAEVTGVARSSGQRAGFTVITEDDLAPQLAKTDVLIMLLPSVPETAQALNAERLALLPQGALLVNVGRGSTVDEAALLDSLNSGHLAGAALDVVAQEPLPSSSPLWEHPKVLITPHSAGGRPIGADELLEYNIKALREGRPLRNQVR